MRHFFLAALLCLGPATILAVEPAMPGAPLEKPIKLPPASGINNSRTPTDIQISVPGQPAYSTSIPPGHGKTAIKTTAPASHACMRMQAPYRAGLWEITSISSNSLMPEPITAKVKRCITERDALNACGLNQLSGGRNRDCQMTDMQVSDGVARWAMHCDSPTFSGQGSGESRFTADHYEGSFTMQANLQGSQLEMQTRFTGKRLGHCK